MDKKDELIGKLEELIEILKDYNPSWSKSEHDKRIELDLHISALESEIKHEQIKEAWTTETDGEPEPGEVLTDKGIYFEDES